jgi:hypothetical protein
MNPAIPTPFDIIPPPPPVWTPSLQVWLLLAAIICGSILYLIIKRRRVPPPPLGYREQLLSDIRQCLVHNENVDLEHVVQLALRTLSYTTGEEYGSESAMSLKRRSETEVTPLLSGLLEKVAASKDLLYSPNPSKEEIVMSARNLAVSAEEVLSAAASAEPSQ